MELCLSKKTLPYKRKIFDHTAEHTEENDIIVPDYLPDIGKVVEVESCVHVKDEIAEKDEVILCCELVHTILYLPEKSNCIRSIVTRGTFRHSFKARQLPAGVDVCGCAKVEQCDCRVTNSRKLRITCQISVGAVVYEDAVLELPCGLSEEMEREAEIRHRGLEFFLPVELGRKLFDLEEELELPQGKQPVVELLQSKGSLLVKEVKSEKGKVSVRGCAVLQILFLTNSETGEVDHMEWELPFFQTIDVRGAKEGQMVDVDLRMLGQNVKTYENDEGEGRILRLEMAICATATVYEQGQELVMQDGYAIGGKLDIKYQEMTLPQLDDQVETQLTLKEVLPLHEREGEGNKIICAQAVPLLSSPVSSDGKVELHGVVDVRLLCLQGEKKEYVSLKKALPFHYVRQLKHPVDQCHYQTEVEVQGISYNINMSGELELRVLCRLKLRITWELSWQMITQMTKTQEQRPDFCGAVIYYKKPGETLWEIGKRYGVCRADLLSCNEAEKEEELLEKKRLLIP